MIGSNVPAVGGYKTAFSYADRWKCESIQIYTTPSRTWKVPDISNEFIDEFIALYKKSLVKCIVAHVPFLVNLASPEEEKRNKSIERLIVEYNRAGSLEIPYIILHPGSYGKGSLKGGLDNIVSALDIVFQKADKCNVKILLETMSGQGSTIGKTFDELSEILNEVQNNEALGVCFDTAHVFQSGYDLSSDRGYEKTFTEFEEKVGLDKLYAFHINDSKTECFSKRDLHANIGEGKIGLPFFERLVNDNRFKNIPKILEVPDRDNDSERNIMLLNSMILC